MSDIPTKIELDSASATVHTVVDADWRMPSASLQSCIHAQRYAEDAARVLATLSREETPGVRQSLRTAALALLRVAIQTVEASS